MEKGDLSNDFPPRVLVSLNIITIEVEETSRFLGIVPTTRIRRKYDRIALNKMWQFSSKMGVTLELFDTGCSQAEMDKVYEDLDRTGLNPFRTCTAYATVGELVRELPFRPEVIGVVDEPDKTFVYGSKYFDLNRI